MLRNLSYAVNVSKETPYISGNTITYWGFISASLELKNNYLILTKEKINTIFELGGDVWGYDLELFNYYNEKEILIEPERTIIIDKIIENNITKINCTIVKTPLILNDIKEDFNCIINDGNKNYINENDFPIWYKYIVRFEIETKEKEESISGIGILCNIPTKKIQALITFNHIIGFDFLNKEKAMIIYNNNEQIEIDMKINRYKYTYEDSNITIIEIVEEDKIDNFIEIDTLINLGKFDEIKIVQISMNENKIIESFDGEIIEKNNGYICSIESKKDGIILLKENNKCIGLIYNNEIIPMDLFIDKINFIKCVYDIKTEDIGKEIQIINNINYLDQIVNNLNKEIKLIINGEIKLNILKHIFENKGKHIVYLIHDNNLTNISSMFHHCSRLEKIDLSLLNTSLVTDMSGMFCGCSSLKELDLFSFNTNKVTNMRSMFINCSSLEKLNISSFNTKQVKDMSFMFDSCYKLEELNVSLFNTNQVTNMQYMFCSCISLKELDVSSFETNQVTNMSDMFRDCSKLKKLNLETFNTSQVTDMDRMFYQCTSLKEINLTSFWTDKVTTMASMFNNCSSLEKLNLSSFNTNQVTYMGDMFRNCSKLKELDLSSFNTNNVYTMSNMFRDCSSLQELDLSSFNSKKNLDVDGMFRSVNKSCKIKCKDKKILKAFKSGVGCIII